MRSIKIPELISFVPVATGAYVLAELTQKHLIRTGSPIYMSEPLFWILTLLLWPKLVLFEVDVNVYGGVVTASRLARAFWLGLIWIIAIEACRAAAVVLISRNQRATDV